MPVRHKTSISLSLLHAVTTERAQSISMPTTQITLLYSSTNIGWGLFITPKWKSQQNGLFRALYCNDLHVEHCISILELLILRWYNEKKRKYWVLLLQWLLCWSIHLHSDWISDRDRLGYIDITSADLGLLLQTCINLNPSKDKKSHTRKLAWWITYPFQTSTAAPNGYVISSHIS